MTHTEVTQLMAENMRIMGRLANRLQPLFEGSKQSRQQMTVLVRLYLSGKIKLKDFSAREVISTANLCSVFRKLEQDKLVVRSTDPDDHRDTWYEVTKSGKVLAEKMIDGDTQAKNQITNYYSNYIIFTFNCQRKKREQIKK